MMTISFGGNRTFNKFVHFTPIPLALTSERHSAFIGVATTQTCEVTARRLHRVHKPALVAEYVVEYERRDDGRIRLDDEAWRLQSKLAPRDLFVGDSPAV